MNGYTNDPYHIARRMRQLVDEDATLATSVSSLALAACELLDDFDDDGDVLPHYYDTAFAVINGNEPVADEQLDETRRVAYNSRKATKVRNERNSATQRAHAF